MKTVLIPTLTAAKNVDIYNASFISETDDLDNGSVFGKGDMNQYERGNETLCILGTD